VLASLAPTTALHRPVPHFVQTDAPPVLYRPASHIWHSLAFAAPLKAPAAQGVHADAPEGLKLPAVHGVSISDAQAEPAGLCTHTPSTSL
jgi:hypothetical protein